MKSKIHTPFAGQNIITRGLPKTNWVTSHAEGDDGYHQKGWWKGRTVANNKTRFIPKAIGGADVVIDRATGLMWAADGNGYGCKNGLTANWAAALVWANDMFWAGFTDWRIPNIIELLSIVNFTRWDPAINPTLFPNTHFNEYWTSTTAFFPDTSAWIIHFSQGINSQQDKTNTYYLRCVRGG